MHRSRDMRRMIAELKTAYNARLKHLGANKALMSRGIPQQKQIARAGVEVTASP